MLGIQVLYSSKTPVVDIVFVHGIRGDSHHTWASSVPKSNTSGNSQSFWKSFSGPKDHKSDSQLPAAVIWPRDFLPTAVPDARISTYGYDADVSVFFNKTANSSVFGIAQDLVTRLEILREADETSEIPIIFVAHSLGGIVVKDALKFSQDQHGFQEHLYSIYHNAYGVVFFGTPHRGSAMASLGLLAAKVAGLGMAESDQSLLRSLETGSVELQRIADSFSRMLPKTGKGLKIYCFQEGMPLTGLRIAGKVVEDYSSIIGDAYEGKAFIHANHMEMCRFSDESSSDYQLVIAVLKRWVRHARKGKETLNPAPNESDPSAAAFNSGAQARLQIVAEPTPISLASDSRPLFCLPYVPVRYFLGRNVELSNITKLFEAEKGLGSYQRIVVLHGLGGVGKTQLALTYAYRNKEKYKLIFYINAATPSSIVFGFRQLAQTLVDWAAEFRGSTLNFTRIAYELGIAQLVSPTTGEVISSESTAEVLVDAMKLWLSREENAGWLIIFDSADDLEGVNLPKYFPNSATGDILVLSRRSDASQLGASIEVRCLSPLDAGEVLISILDFKDGEGSLEQRDDYHLVAQILGHLPLASAQAGSFMSATRTSPKEYIKLYRQEQRRLLSSKPPLALWQYGETVFTTWELSYSAIKKVSSVAATVLLICGYYQPENIPYSILVRGKSSGGWRAQVWKSAAEHSTSRLRLKLRNVMTSIFARRKTESEDENLSLLEMPADISSLRQVISLLSKYSLITQNIADDNFSMHSLVRSWCVNRDTPNRSHVVAQAILSLGQALDVQGENLQSWPLLYSLYPHALEASKSLIHLDDTEMEIGSLRVELIASLDATGRCLQQMEYAKESRTFFESAFSWSTAVFGPKHKLTLHMLDRIATTVEMEGRLEDAEALHRECLERSIKYLGKNDRGIYVSMNNLGANLAAQSKSQEANKILKVTVEKRLELYGPDDTYESLINLGATHADLGEFEEAEKLFSLAQKGILARPEPDVAHYATAGGLLALSQADRGHREQAESTLESVVNFVQQKYGPSHPKSLEWRGNLIQFYAEASSAHYRERRFEILSMSRCLEEDWRALMGTDTEHTVSVRRQIGIVFRDTGDFETAEQLFCEALAMGRTLLEIRGTPKFASQVATILSDLGFLYWDRGRLQDAIRNYDCSLETAQAANLTYWPLLNVWDVRANRAVALRDLGRLSEAEQELKNVIKARALEQRRGDSLVEQINLASVYQLQQRHEEAMALYTSTLTAMQDRSLPADPYLLLGRHHLAILHEKLGREEDAISILEEIMEEKEKVLGLASPATLKTALALGRLYRKNKYAERAAVLAERIRPHLDCA